MTDLSFIPPARPLLGVEEASAAAHVATSGHLAQGDEVGKFEEEFRKHFNFGACAAVSSGTAALHAGLLACGISPGDEVIVPSFTFAATANAVALTGATPVFADIEPDTFCLDPASAERAITGRTRMIMPVHLYGHPANMSSLVAIAQRHDLLLAEDAAQAHGATFLGVPVGAFGAFGAFSFYATKNMTTGGEGGMVAAATSQAVTKVRLLRNQGMLLPYTNEIVGLNYRMTEIQAAIGRAQLAKVNLFTQLRQERAWFFTSNLEGVVTPTVAPHCSHVFHQYTIRIPEGRDRFHRALREEYRIGASIFYPTPCHRLETFSDLPPVDLPETQRAVDECLSLPVHPAVTACDQERIVNAVNRLTKAGA